MITGEERHSPLAGDVGRVIFGRHRDSQFGYLPAADSRPLNVISKAFNAAFHRLDQRF